MRKRAATSLVALCTLGIASPQGGAQTIDHRFMTERQYTLLSLPFDPHKTILLGNGNLAYDFGPGPYHEAGTEIGFSPSGASSSVTSQYFEDPLIPVATTAIRGSSGEIVETAFSVIPHATEFPSRFRHGPVSRTGHLAGAVRWADPPPGADPAFRGVAWGTNRPVTYRIGVSPGSAHFVVLGVCEGYKSAPGQRVLEYRVEGAPPRTIDPAAHGGRNTPHVLLFPARDEDGDGSITVEAGFSPAGGDPNVILSAIWMFPEGTPVDTGAVMRGEMSARAEVYWPCGNELTMLSPEPRTDAVIAECGTDGAPPVLHVSTRREIRYDTARRILLLEPGMVIRCVPPPERGTVDSARHKGEWTFPTGTRRVEMAVTQESEEGPETLPLDAVAELRRARGYWSGDTIVPRARLTLPDRALQSILDVNIRALYQAADMVGGYPVFQPGPTVYRGLFLYDLLLIGDALMTLGDFPSARRFIEGTFPYQQGDGRVRVLKPANSYLETPVFVDALGRYALSSGDSAWLNAQWPRMVRAVGWMRDIRRTTTADGSAPGYGLFPPGFVDGGLAGAVPDFSTVTFALMALETACTTARWLGFDKEESEWRSQFDDLMESYLRAARKNLRRDAHGTVYLPVTVGDTSSAAPPQRGQYGFLGALRYAKYFRHHTAFLDSVVSGNMTMLDSTLCEGMIQNSGWTRGAVWSWLALAHASALSATGRGGRALAMIYDVANHAGRLGTWVEEQQVRSAGSRSTGDGSDAETSACLITALRDILLFDRGDTIDVLPGAPADWFRPGARIACRDVPTESGRLTIDAVSSPSEVLIRLRLAGPCAGTRTGVIVALNPETLLNARPAPGKKAPGQLCGRLERGKEVEIRLTR